jgi:toxin ParE1/3/4
MLYVPLFGSWTFSSWGRDRADQYVRALQRAIELVAENPLIGRACDEIRADYRKHSVGSHVSFYRPTDLGSANGVIGIVRILHQRMDVDRHLD